MVACLGHEPRSRHETSWLTPCSQVLQGSARRRWRYGLDLTRTTEKLHTTCPAAYTNPATEVSISQCDVGAKIVKAYAINSHDNGALCGV